MWQSSKISLEDLATAAFNFPIIDNHAHNLLKEEHRSAFPFEGLTSEATGSALEDATSTLPAYRATLQLAKFFSCDPNFEAVKKALDAIPYIKLCDMCLEPTGIACLLLDDGLDNIDELCYDYKWHDRFTSAKSKRLVRIEALAQTLMKQLNTNEDNQSNSFSQFVERFENILIANCKNADVVGFKSVACYRTGLDIKRPERSAVIKEYDAAILCLQHNGTLRLASKALNDFIVRMVLQIAGEYHKPVQFHTGLGDNDITLSLSNPAVMQHVIQEFPNTIFVLLHSSYPFTREAGYLATVYKNVYLDFGEVFPAVSADGQCAIVRQLLELTPTNKILWSTDGHWWPETYYLGTLQVREALFEVLSDTVIRGDMTQAQAVTIVERVLFHNSNDLYQLGLAPQPTNCNISHKKLSITPTSTSTLQDLAAQGTQFVRLHWVDFANTLRCRVLPIMRLQSMLANSTCAGITLTKACLGLFMEGLAPGFNASGEYLLAPDMETLRVCPYAQGHAFIMGTLKEKEPIAQKDGTSTTEVDIDPRTVLKRIVNSAKVQHGLDFLLGFEIEFVLLAPGVEFLTPASEHGWSFASSLPTGSPVAKVLDEIAIALKTCGIELEQFHAEAAAGAYEVATGPLPPLQAVDALVITREIISNLAKKHGLYATFSPRPFSTEGGIASHVHISLTCSEISYPAEHVPISNVEAAFLQSLLDHLPAIQAFTLPTEASYDRIVDGIWSGGTWVCWGRDNREAPVRLCGSAPHDWNFEVKMLDGTANPYLAITALLYSGILGVQKGLKLRSGDCQGSAEDMGEAGRASLGIRDRLARDLGEAIKALKKDEELVEAFGKDLIFKYISTIEMRRDIIAKIGDQEEQRIWMAKLY